MDYKAITAEFQDLIDIESDRNFYRNLESIAERLEQTDDLKVLKVIARYKKLLTELGDPFNWQRFKFHETNNQNEIKELTIKLIDFLNDHFEFLKPLK